MNHDEQFEKRLQRQSLRQLPSAWRAEILEAARTSAVSRHAPRTTHHVPWWRELLLSYPRAWAALGAAWVVILALNFTARDTSLANLTQNNARPVPRMEDLLRQKQQLFAELAGLGDQPEADRPKAIVPRPRSESQCDSANA